MREGAAKVLNCYDMNSSGYLSEDSELYPGY